MGHRIRPEKNDISGFASLSELLSYLDDHGGNAAVIVALKPPPGKIVPATSETKRIATELIVRAEKATGLRVAGSNVFQYLGRFVLNAPSEIIRHIAVQPEVTETTPNKLRGSGLIKPVRRRPADA